MIEVALPANLRARLPDGVTVLAYEGIIECGNQGNYNVTNKLLSSQHVQQIEATLITDARKPEVVLSGSFVLPLTSFNGYRVRLYVFREKGGDDLRDFAALNLGTSNWMFLQNDGAASHMFKHWTRSAIQKGGCLVSLAIPAIFGGVGFFMTSKDFAPGEFASGRDFIVWPNFLCGLVIFPLGWFLLVLPMIAAKKQVRYAKKTLTLIRDITYWLRGQENMPVDHQSEPP